MLSIYKEKGYKPQSALYTTEQDELYYVVDGGNHLALIHGLRYQKNVSSATINISDPSEAEWKRFDSIESTRDGHTLVDMSEEEYRRPDKVAILEDVEVVRNLCDRYVEALPQESRPVMNAFNEE